MRQALRHLRWPVIVYTAALFLVASPQIRAESASITATDGSVVSAWEVRVHGPAGDPDGSDGLAADASALYYSITNGSGTLIGAVPPTSDPASDTQPTLALDPSTGSVSLLWSRFDGVSFKIAYARLEAGAWTDFHFLTFGPVGEFEPRVGSSSTGSYLFWLGPDGLCFYAPIDLAAGRLLAAGSVIRIRPVITGGRTLQAGSGASPSVGRGGTRGAPGRRDVLDPGSGTLGTEGDAPFPPGHSSGSKQKPKGASVWGVRGSPGCRSLILVIPDVSLGIVHVLHFVNGVTREIGRTTIPNPLPDRFADGLASAYLNPNCQ